MSDEEQQGLRGFVNGNGGILGLIGGIVSIVTILLKVADKLPPPAFYFLAGVGGALILVYITKLVFVSSNRPVESIGKLSPDIAFAKLLPDITINIKEVYLRPFQNSADCFIHVILINLSPNVPTSFQTYYKVLLTIGGKAYEGYLASLSGYCGYDRKHKGTKPAPLASIKTKLDDSMLISGKHKDGWLRFRFDELPDWPEGEPYLSGVYTQVNEETKEEYEKEVYEKPYLTTTAMAIKLVFKDSFGVERSGEAKLPCWEESRVIRRPGHVKPSLD